MSMTVSGMSDDAWVDENENKLRVAVSSVIYRKAEFSSLLDIA